VHASFAAGRLLIALAALLLVPFALTACGSSSSDTTPEGTWAQSFCAALGTWKSSVTAAGNTLKNSGDLSKNTAQQAVDSISSANKKLVDDVTALGKPSGSAGSEAKADVQQLSQELNADADKVESTMKGVSNTQELLGAVPALAGVASSAASSVSSTISELQSLDASKEWKQAFQNSEACQSLKKG
jgi:hypothetical protein